MLGVAASHDTATACDAPITAGVKRIVKAKAAGRGRGVLDVVTGFQGA